MLLDLEKYYMTKYLIRFKSAGKNKLVFFAQDINFIALAESYYIGSDI